jgi:hypothetical protein
MHEIVQKGNMLKDLRYASSEDPAICKTKGRYRIIKTADMMKPRSWRDVKDGCSQDVYKSTLIEILDYVLKIMSQTYEIHLRVVKDMAHDKAHGVMKDVFTSTNYEKTFVGIAQIVLDGFVYEKL